MRTRQHYNRPSVVRQQRCIIVTLLLIIGFLLWLIIRQGNEIEALKLAAEEIARQAMEKPGGARNIRHLLQTLVQTPLSDALLSDVPAKKLRVLAREGKLVVSVTDGDRAETGK